MSSPWHHALHLLQAAQQMALRTDQINWGGAIQAVHRCAKGATKSYPAAAGCFLWIYLVMLVIGCILIVFFRSLGDFGVGFWWEWILDHSCYPEIDAEVQTKSEQRPGPITC